MIKDDEGRAYYKWKEQDKEVFERKLTDDIGSAFLINFTEKLGTMESVNTICDSLGTYLRQALDRSMKMVNKARTTVYPHNAWHDNECKEIRRELFF